MCFETRLKGTGRWGSFGIAREIIPYLRCIVIRCNIITKRHMHSLRASYLRNVHDLKLNFQSVCSIC